MKPSSVNKTKAEVIHVTTGLSRSGGGPFFSVSGLAAALEADGQIESRVVGAYRDATEWSEDSRQWQHTGIDAFPGRGLRPVAAMASAACRRLLAARSAGRQAAIHLHGIWDGGSLAVECVRWGCGGNPTVISPRGMLEPWALLQSRLKKKVAWLLWQRRLFDTADLLHATAEQECENIRRLGLRSPIAVIPNGIQFPDLAPPQESQPHRKRRCVFLSRLHPKKGLPMLLEAWSRLKPSGWSLEIAGPAETGHDQEIRHLISRLDLVDVRLIGELRGAGKWDFLRTADLFILPSYSENFGIAVAEAMAAGLPVITTRTTPWQAIRDLDLGWWIEPNIDAVAGALAEAMREPQESLRARGLRARSHVISEYGWRGIARRMADCYLWLLGLGPSTSDLRFA